jgi:hypothetical protein
MYIFWILIFFKIVNVFLMCFIGYYHFFFFYHQLIFMMWILWKSFVKMSILNDKKFHFQKTLTKPKL